MLRNNSLSLWRLRYLSSSSKEVYLFATRIVPEIVSSVEFPIDQNSLKQFAFLYLFLYLWGCNIYFLVGICQVVHMCRLFAKKSLSNILKYLFYVSKKKLRNSDVKGKSFCHSVCCKEVCYMNLNMKRSSFSSSFVPLDFQIPLETTKSLTK